jgi:hypothetical protein
VEHAIELLLQRFFRKYLLILLSSKAFCVYVSRGEEFRERERE